MQFKAGREVTFDPRKRLTAQIASLGAVLEDGDVLT